MKKACDKIANNLGNIAKYGKYKTGNLEGVELFFLFNSIPTRVDLSAQVKFCMKLTSVVIKQKAMAQNCWQIDLKISEELWPDKKADLMKRD